VIRLTNASTTVVVASVLIAVTGCGLATRTSPPLPSATPVASANPTPIAANVLCRLPIDNGTGAFVDIPTTPPLRPIDQVRDDPSSQVKLPNGEPRVALSYDWPLQRWLPVPYKWVAPDGTRYAYSDSQSRVHVVEVKNNSDRIVASGAYWGVYAFAADGIYVGQRDPSKQPSLLGLWRISKTGGSPQILTSQGTWLGIGPDAAWSVVQESSPSVFWPSPENSFGRVLKRLDLKTRQITTWYTSEGGRFRVAAVDSNGRPVLLGLDERLVWVVTAAGMVEAFGHGFVTDAIVDSHGIWYLDHSVINLIQGSFDRRIGQGPLGVRLGFAGPCG